MILTLDLASDRPLFNQIVDGVKRSLVDGQLEVGESLPPGRELAAALDVSLETVQRAYRQLADEGVVTSRVGRGTRVAESIDIGAMELSSSVDDLVEEARAAGISRERLIELIESSYG